MPGWFSPFQNCVPCLIVLHVCNRSFMAQVWWLCELDVFINEQIIHKSHLLCSDSSWHLWCPWEVVFQPICPYINMRRSTMIAVPILHIHSDSITLWNSCPFSATEKTVLQIYIVHILLLLWTLCKTLKWHPACPAATCKWQHVPAVASITP